MKIVDCIIVQSGDKIFCITRKKPPVLSMQDMLPGQINILYRKSKEKTKQERILQ